MVAEVEDPFPTFSIFLESIPMANSMLQMLLKPLVTVSRITGGRRRFKWGFLGRRSLWALFFLHWFWRKWKE